MNKLTQQRITKENDYRLLWANCLLKGKCYGTLILSSVPTCQVLSPYACILQAIYTIKGIWKHRTRASFCLTTSYQSYEIYIRSALAYCVRKNIGLAFVAVFTYGCTFKTTMLSVKVSYT